MNSRSFALIALVIFIVGISSCRKDNPEPDITSPVIEIASPADGSIINYLDTLRIVATFSDVSGLNEVSVTLRDAQGNLVWQPSVSFVPGGTALHMNEIVINNLSDTSLCVLTFRATDSKGNVSSVVLQVTLNGSGFQVAASEDYARDIQLVSEAVHIADEAISTGTFGTCAIVSLDTLNATDPDTLTVNFGSGPCIDLDGRFRTGAIQVIYPSGSYHDSLTSKQLNFINYSVNDNMVSGSVTVLNSGMISSCRTYSVNASATITGNTYTTDMAGQLTFSQFTGSATPAFTDDGWVIDGASTGHNRYGTAYSAQINTALRKYSACWRYFVEGTVTVTPANSISQFLDYGNGACDNYANVTVGANTFMIYLL